MRADLVPLGELSDVQTGKLDANESSEDGGYPFFTCALEPLKIDRWTYDLDAVLVAGNGDLNVKHYRGKFEAYQRTYILSSKAPERLDTRYLYHFMETYVSTLRRQSIGGIIKYIKMGMLTEALVPLPPLEEQKRIAAILDQADALRRLRARALDRLNALGQAIFHEMFGEPVNDVASSNTNHSSRSGDWVLCALGDQLLLQRGKDITSKEVRPGSVPVISSGGISFFHDEPLVKGPGVLLGRKGSVGKVHFARGDFWPHDTTLYVKNFKNNDPLFIYYFFRQFPISRYEASAANPSLNRNNLHPVKVLWPPIKLQRQFALRVKAVEAQTEVISSLLEQTDSLFSSLQHRAFRGEL